MARVHLASRRDDPLHWVYLIGLWFKGVDGVLELLAGALFLFIGKAVLNTVVFRLTRSELVEDPTDWIALHLRHAVSLLSSDTKLFASIYLLGHGAIKVFLVWGGLWRGKMWAFPTALAFLGGFVVYQSYRMSHRFSVALLVLTCLDVIVLLLIWREYRLARRRAHSRA